MPVDARAQTKLCPATNRGQGRLPSAAAASLDGSINLRNHGPARVPYHNTASIKCRCPCTSAGGVNAIHWLSETSINTELQTDPAGPWHSGAVGAPAGPCSLIGGLPAGMAVRLRCIYARRFGTRRKTSVRNRRRICRCATGWLVLRYHFRVARLPAPELQHAITAQIVGPPRQAAPGRPGLPRSEGVRGRRLTPSHRPT